MKEIGSFTFICSALYDPITDGKFKGHRHHEIIKAMQEEGYPSHIVKRCVQGFMIRHCDDKNDYFISRDIATEIAKDNDFPMIGNVLTSEDLW